METLLSLMDSGELRVLRERVLTRIGKTQFLADEIADLSAVLKLLEAELAEKAARS